MYLKAIGLFFIVMTFSGCLTNTGNLSIKVSKEDLKGSIVWRELAIEKNLKKINYASYNEKSISRRAYLREENIQNYSELLYATMNYLYSIRLSDTTQEKNLFLKKAENYFRKSQEDYLICHYKKDLDCSLENKDAECYLGKGLSTSQKCSSEKYNTEMIEYMDYHLKYKKYGCNGNSKEFTIKEKVHCENSLNHYVYLFENMRKLYANEGMFDKEREVLNKYKLFMKKNINRYPKSDKSRLLKKQGAYLLEYGYLLQLTNRDILLAQARLKKLDEEFLPELEKFIKIDVTDENEYSDERQLMYRVFNARIITYLNIHFYLKPSESEMLRYVDETAKYGEVLYKSTIHSAYVKIAIKHDYPNLVENFLARDKGASEDLSSEIDILLNRQQQTIKAKQWQEALKITDRLKELHKENNLLWISHSSQLRRNAYIFEHLGEYKKSISYANKEINIVEGDRDFSSAKLGFFNKDNTEIYKSLIRSRYAIYEQSKKFQNFSELMNDIERLRSRTLKDQNNKSQNIDIKILQKRLSKSEIILGYVDLDEYYLAYTVSKDAINTFKINNIEKVNSLVSKIRPQLANPSSSLRELEIDLSSLSNLIVSPLALELETAKSIFLLTDGNLNFIPFDILSKNSAKYESMIQSTSILLEPYMTNINKKLSKRKNNKFLAIANPKFSKYIAFEGADPISFEALPETYDEVKMISRYFKKGKSKIISAKKANLETLKKIDFSSYAYIHFATHGILGYEIPGINEPSLILSNNTFLTASEVRKLKLNARITVLSACNTGSGKYSTGEGVMGIGQAFLSSGSESVVVSLWQVPSLETVTLMEVFYKNMNRGKSVSQALRLAKLKLIESNKKVKVSNSRGLKRKNSKQKYSNTLHPFYWAAFVIIGS